MKCFNQLINVTLILLFFTLSVYGENTFKSKQLTVIDSVEDIKLNFKLPKNWHYYKNPKKEILVGLAGNPTENIISIAIWESKTKNETAFLHEIKNYLKNQNSTMTYTMENDTYTGVTTKTINGIDNHFMWKGKIVYLKDKFQLIAIGAIKNLYKTKEEEINSILNTVKQP